MPNPGCIPPIGRGKQSFAPTTCFFDSEFSNSDLILHANASLLYCSKSNSHPLFKEKNDSSCLTHLAALTVCEPIFAALLWLTVLDLSTATTAPGNANLVEPGDASALG